MRAVAVELARAGRGRAAGVASHSRLRELEVDVRVAVVHDALGAEEDFLQICYTGRGVRAADGVDVADVVLGWHRSRAPSLDGNAPFRIEHQRVAVFLTALSGVNGGIAVGCLQTGPGVDARVLVCGQRVYLERDRIDVVRANGPGRRRDGRDRRRLCAVALPAVKQASGPAQVDRDTFRQFSNLLLFRGAKLRPA